jgi:hypothetical protein
MIYLLFALKIVCWAFPTVQLAGTSAPLKNSIAHATENIAQGSAGTLIGRAGCSSINSPAGLTKATIDVVQKDLSENKVSMLNIKWFGPNSRTVTERQARKLIDRLC